MFLAVAAIGLAMALAAAPAGFAAGPKTDGSGKPSKPASGPAATAQGPKSAQGVVQFLTPTAVVVKELDGSSVSVPVDQGTQVLVNGTLAVLGDVEPGFVAIASWTGNNPAQELETFNSSSATTTGVEIVQSILPNAVVLTVGGSTTTIQVNAKTHVFVNGKPAKLQDVKPGFTIVLSGPISKGEKASAELRFLRPS